MKKLLTAAIALSVLASAGVASAQPMNQNRHDNRYEQSQSRHDRDDRFERRSDRRYAAGRYQQPRGYQNHQWRRGERLPSSYRSRAYVVDHHRYGLRAPPRGYQYVRVNNDVVLTAIATGVITSVILQMFR